LAGLPEPGEKLLAFGSAETNGAEKPSFRVPSYRVTGGGFGLLQSLQPGLPNFLWCLPKTFSFFVSKLSGFPHFSDARQLPLLYFLYVALELAQLLDNSLAHLDLPSCEAGKLVCHHVDKDGPGWERAKELGLGV
jgi:hypothetical protein